MGPDEGQIVSASLVIWHSSQVLLDSLRLASPLGVRWFRSTFNQNNPFPYPLSGPPIRWPWITRERTSLSFEVLPGPPLNPSFEILVYIPWAPKPYACGPGNLDRHDFVFQISSSVLQPATPLPPYLPPRPPPWRKKTWRKKPGEKKLANKTWRTKPWRTKTLAKRTSAVAGGAGRGGAGAQLGHEITTDKNYVVVY